MRNVRRNLLIGVVACWPAMGSACLYPPPPPRQADETDAQYKDRSTKALEAYITAASRKRETSYFHEADRVFFARIIQSEEIAVGGAPYARRVVVRPLQGIKGTPPRRAFSLTDRELTSCGLNGDGPATSGSVGHIAIVFDGVRNEGLSYRSRRYALLASDASDPELVKAWGAWKETASFSFNQ